MRIGRAYSRCLVSRLADGMRSMPATLGAHLRYTSSDQPASASSRSGSGVDRKTRRCLEEFQPDQVERIVADATYAGDAIRIRAQELKAEACIKAINARSEPIDYDREHDKHRNVIERFLGRIKNFRRVATRYDEKPFNFAGFVWLAAWFYG